MLGSGVGCRRGPPETQVGAKMEQTWPLLVFFLGLSLDLGGEEGGHSLSRENETGVA